MVRGVSSKGYGVVAHPEGQVFFVKGVWPGDHCLFEVETFGKRYGFARQEKMLSPSPDRVLPACPFQGFIQSKCGGCPWMQASYSSQLAMKENRIRHSLKRSGLNLNAGIFSPIRPSPNVLGYRNRAQFKTDGRLIGYVSEGTNTIAPIDDCLILNPVVRKIFHDIKKQLPRSDWIPGQGFKWNFIDVDETLDPSRVILNRRRPFAQGNREQNIFMQEWLRSSLKDMEKGRILELFCGSGNFTGIIAQEASEEILSIDVQGEALENLSRINLPHVKTKARDLFAPGVWWSIASEVGVVDTLVLDPPRDGLKNRSGFFKAMPRLQNIIYISCDVESYARDARHFYDHGFHLTKLLPLDQFPHTPHVEILSVFKRSC